MNGAPIDITRAKVRNSDPNAPKTGRVKIGRRSGSNPSLMSPTNVNAFGASAEPVPSKFVTDTETVSGSDRGVTASTMVESMNFTSVADSEPKLTKGAGTCGRQKKQFLLKPLPLMITRVPPVSGPEFGVTEVILGAATAAEPAKERTSRSRPIISGSYHAGSLREA